MQGEKSTLFQNSYIVRQIHLSVGAEDFFQLIDGRGKEFILVVDKLEFSVPFSGFISEDLDRMMPDLVLHKAYGHNRQDLVGKYCIEKSARTVGFPGSLDMQGMPDGIVFKKLSGTASIFPDCEFLPVQFTDVDPVPGIEWMIFSGGQNKAVIDHGENDQIGRMDLAFNHSCIQFRAEKLLFDGLGVGDKRVNLKIRKFFLKIKDNGRGQAGSHCDGGTKLQGGRLTLILHQFLQLLKLTDHFPGVREKQFSTVCEIEFSAKTFKEKTVVMCFQFPDGLADRWLGEIKMFGGSTHGALFCNGYKNSEMADGHVKSSLCGMYR